MGAFKVERATPESRAFAAVLTLGVLVLASLPYWGGSGNMRLVSEMAYYLALAQLWNLLAGYAGLVSVGQQAFVGIGAYTLFYLVERARSAPAARARPGCAGLCAAVRCPWRC